MKSQLELGEEEMGLQSSSCGTQLRGSPPTAAQLGEQLMV